MKKMYLSLFLLYLIYYLFLLSSNSSQVTEIGKEVFRDETDYNHYTITTPLEKLTHIENLVNIQLVARSLASRSAKM